jgi:branched-chain amino acid transport system substrate-binding protein
LCAIRLALLMAVTPAAASQIVGLAVPSNGPKVAFGEQLVTVTRAAIAELNAAGGINGEPLTLQIEDDGCTADGGATVAAKFIAAKVALVVGHPCSNAALAAAKAYAGSGTVFLAIGARHPDLTAKRAGAAIFRMGGRDDRQAADTVSEFIDRLKGQRVAIVHDRTAYARNLADGVTAQFKAHGVTDIVTGTLVAGEKDYGALVAQLKAANPAAIYFAGFPNEAELVVNGLRANGVTALMIGCDALAGSSVQANGVHVMTPVAHDATLQSVSSILSAWATAWAAATTDTVADAAAPGLEASNSARVANALGKWVARLTAAWNADKNGDLPGASFMSNPKPAQKPAQ